MVLPTRRKALVVSIDGKVQASGSEAPREDTRSDTRAAARTYRKAKGTKTKAPVSLAEPQAVVHSTALPGGQSHDGLIGDPGLHPSARGEAKHAAHSGQRHLISIAESPAFRAVLILSLAVFVIPAIVRAQARSPEAAKASGAAGPAIRFEDATAKSGIDFRHSMGSRQLGSLLEGTGGGCVWFDYNNDGLPDLYLVSGRPLDDAIHPYPLKQKPAEAPHNHLYRNNGDGTFTDVTAKAGLAPDLYSVAVAAADYDNDGSVDLLVTGYGRAILYHNNGDGTFTDVTARAGIKVNGWSISSTWLDYDRDGCPDLFIGRYVKFDPTYHNYYAADNYPGPLDYGGDSNVLYHNTCDGTFTDVSDAAGISAFLGRTMGVTAADFDGDGWPDIYVSNDKTENFLFHNNHNGTFTEMAVDAEVAYGQNGEATSSMGPVFADVEGTGRLDLWVTDSKYNRLMRNTGAMRFDDIGAAAGLSEAEAQYTSWGTGVYDFDNDGWPDILVFHGGLIHLIPQEHSLFRNLGGGKFADVSRTGGSVLDAKSVARGACFADYRNNGKVGAFVVNLDAPGTLLDNVTATHAHWIAVELRGAARKGSEGQGSGNRDQGTGNTTAGPSTSPSLRSGSARDDKTVDHAHTSGAKAPSGSDDVRAEARTYPLAPNSDRDHGLAVGGSNRDGLGARLELTAGGRTQVAERTAGSGYLSQDDGRVHFGLGAASMVEKLVIRWPSGKVQTLESLAVDRVVTVEEPR